MGHPAVAIGGRQVGLDTGLVKRGQLSRDAVDNQLFAVCVAHQQAVFRGLGVAIDQDGCVRVACQIVKVHFAGAHQFMHESEDKQAVGAWSDADPFIGDCVITRPDRVDADDFCASGFYLAQPHLDRVAVMVFGHTEQHEQFGVIPVGLAKFPKRAPHSINASGGHIYRTKSTMRGIVGRAKILRPKAGEGLRLIASGEKRQFLRIILADRLQQIGGHA